MGAQKMPDATRKTVREAEPRSESAFNCEVADRLRRAFQTLAKPLVRDAAGAEHLADVLERVGRGTADLTDVSVCDEVIGLFWGKSVP